MTLNNMEKKQTIITVVFTLLIIITAHWCLLFGNEEKLVALLVYSSFVRVATSGFRRFPYSLVVVVVFDQLRSDSVFTTAQHSNSISDVIRLEHVRNKYSLQ